MIKIIQLLSGLLILLIVIPQTPTENIVLRKFNETGFFQITKMQNSLLIF